MPRAKKEEEVGEAAPKAAPKSKDSEERKAFMLVMETYKEQNPVKFEAKKEALEAKLATL